MHLIVLKEIRDRRVTTLTGMPEVMRQKVIDLGMEEPPLIDTVGEAIIVNCFGERELSKRWRELPHGPCEKKHKEYRGSCPYCGTRLD